MAALTIGRVRRFMRRNMPPLNFITIHYLYFICTCLVSSIIVWASTSRGKELAYIDALFLSVSAMTLAGLNTVNLSTLNTFQQLWLFLLLILGSAIFVSAFVVHVRKSAFESKFKAFIKEAPRKKELGRQILSTKLARTPTPSNLELDHSTGKQAYEPRESEPDGTDKPKENEMGLNGSGRNFPGKPSSPTKSAIAFATDQDTPSQHHARHRRSFLNYQGVGAQPDASLTTRSMCECSSNTEDTPRDPGRIDRYLPSSSGWVGRNSGFHGLTDKERERLGGLEYSAVCFLSWLVPAYFLLFHIFGCLACGAWVANNRPHTALQNGLDPWFVGAFNAVSAFNNSGMSLLDANMTAFYDSYYLLLTMGFFILAGNTCYPVFLRLIIWTIYCVVDRFKGSNERWSKQARMLKFLLDHPRRCYTNLFPAKHTWWLLASVIVLNSIDWAGFEVLNLGNERITDKYPIHYRVIDGLFQAFAVRSGGFYVVPIATVRISLQVLYTVMMYISVFPVVITMRNSNVYEERSLGIYAEDHAPDERLKDHPGILGRLREYFMSGGAARTESNSRFVTQQLRAQLAHDAWTVVGALFLISIIESSKFEKDPANFSIFNFIFEIVSGYGCVGISVGIPWENYSFCGTWQTLSKLILCGVMLRGRHRGLPVAIDRAVLLPGADQEAAEEDDGRIRLARTISRGRSEQRTV